MKFIFLIKLQASHIVYLKAKELHFSLLIFSSKKEMRFEERSRPAKVDLTKRFLEHSVSSRVFWPRRFQTCTYTCACPAFRPSPDRSQPGPGQEYTARLRGPQPLQTLPLGTGSWQALICPFLSPLTWIHIRCILLPSTCKTTALKLCLVRSQVARPIVSLCCRAQPQACDTS